MNSRDRVAAAINKVKSDKVPTSLRCTSEALDKLIKYLNVKTKQEVYDQLDIDFRWIYVPFIGPKERSASPLGSEGFDFWGCYNKAVKNEFNTYYEFTYHPLAECKTVTDIKNYKWPELDWWDYDRIPDIIENECQKDRRAIMFFAGGTFETPWYMRGMEQFFMDIIEEPEIVNAICEKVGEYYLGRAMRVLDKAKGKIDIIGSGGDLGAQETLMINPSAWREHIKPHFRGLIEPFKKMGLKTFYHSDGAITSVINDFIECGLDILDPIQVGAKGMNPENIYSLFGERLTFHGAIDEVELLPNATASEVYEETSRVIRIMNQNNGYIVSPTHQVQGDTPVENILAIFEAVNDLKQN
ncbi:MAG: hypothetical protein JXQ23_10105 [Clostridia bacterium]|nr:hypothetical protein [Clostridia bacterium]